MFLFFSIFLMSHIRSCADLLVSYAHCCSLVRRFIIREVLLEIIVAQILYIAGRSIIGL